MKPIYLKNAINSVSTDRLLNHGYEDNKKDQLYSFTINGKSIEYNKLSRKNQDFLNSDKIKSIKKCIESINNNDQINNIAIDDHWKEFCTTIAGD